MKIKENQELKSSSILALFCLVGFSLAIIATPWNRSLSEVNSEKALQRAEIVGYQLVQLYREAAKDSEMPNKAGRAPASVAPDASDLRTIGSMGTDPWGQAYHYRILSADQNKLRVLVWSSGPDQAVQSTELDNEDIKLKTQPAFSGDDVGVVMTMSLN
jgi:hypothetical protein